MGQTHKKCLHFLRRLHFVCVCGYQGKILANMHFRFILRLKAKDRSMMIGLLPLKHFK